MVKEKEADSAKRSSSYPKRYLITAAQGSYHLEYNSETKEYEPVKSGSVATVHDNLLRGFDKYCKMNDAELIILKMAGKNVRENVMHESLAEREELFFGNRALNSNIKIADMIVPLKTWTLPLED